MMNKDLEQVVCEAIEAHKKNNAPFKRDEFVALLQMAKALYPYTTEEHKIDVISRMKVLVDPRNGLHPQWENDDLFNACIQSIEKQTPGFTITYGEAIIFIEAIKMAMKRIGSGAVSTVAALATKL